MDDDAPLFVLCTAPSGDAGAVLARGIVEAKLAACVNIVPGLRSLFSWNGAVQDEPEVQLFIKTRAGRYGALERWILEHHPYEVPEVLAIPIALGSAKYLEWLKEQTRS